MVKQFSNEDLYLQLKPLYESGDRERFAVLLCETAAPVITVQLKKSVFSIYNSDDKDDAAQDALLYLLDKIDGFMQDPENDPGSDAQHHYSAADKRAWLHMTVYNGLRHSFDRIYRSFSRTVSLDQDSGDEEQSLLEQLSSKAPGPEDQVLVTETCEEACRAFFSLKNTPVLLGCVGYLLLVENLTHVRIPLDEYTEMLNGATLAWIIGQMEELLKTFRMSSSVLDPLKARTDADMLERPIEGLSPQSLSNRKNSMLKTLRAGIQKKKE